MSRRKRLGSSPEVHAKNVHGFITQMGFQVKRARLALEKGACLPAGKAIDRAYESYGAARGHRQGLESSYEAADGAMHTMREQLRKVDAKFESACVRHKPVTALNGRK